MDRARPEPIKHREIGFSDPHPDPQQARSAAMVLNAVEGIVQVSIPDSNRACVHISYDLNCISLRLIEALLGELGYHLDNSLMSKLKRALYYFTEENEIRTLAVQDDQDHSTREIFMRRYRGKKHGCRDARPAHWRKYL